jgi:hypothetical protein
MLARVRSRLTYPHVTSTLALFVALGGTAYAAATIGSAEVINNSLLSEDVKDATLTGADLRENTIGSGRIADGSIIGSDIKQNTIGSLRVADNSLLSADIKNDALTGDDIDESTLDVGAVGVDPPGSDPGLADFPDQAVHTIDVPSSGTLLVQGWADNVAVTCGSDVCYIAWGLYVDGQPIAGSEIAITAGQSQTSASRAVSTVGRLNVGPGTHTVSLGYSESSFATGRTFTDAWVSSVFVQDPD